MEPEKLSVRKSQVEYLRKRLVELNNPPKSLQGDLFIAGERAGIEIALHTLDLMEEENDAE